MKEMSYILSIDQGTSSSRAILFDKKFSVIHSNQLEFKQHFPNEGWVEHNPTDIWNTVFTTTENVIKESSVDINQIASIGITNQRETTLIWDKKTGEEIYPAIVWQDRRTATFCSSIKDVSFEKDIANKTGLIIDPYFSATKIHWILNNVDGARKKADEGRLAFGTIDSYLVWKLTEGRVHKTDATNASRTMLYNIEKDCWDEDLLNFFQIPRKLMPDVANNVDDFGHTTLFGGKINIGGVAGDQQSALIGQGCFNAGEAKCTFGTGAFLIVNTGKTKIHSKNRLLSTIAYKFNNKITYGLEGSVFVAGSAIQWLRDELNFFESATDTEELIQRRNKESQVMVVPAFTGLGAPHWDPETRGAIFGLTRGSGIKEITSATLESIAFQTKDLVEAAKKDGADINQLRIDGGMVANDWFNNQLASLINVKVLKPRILETTALGAAYLAGISSGLVEDLTSLNESVSFEKEIYPAKELSSSINKKYLNWLKAVESTRLIKN
ncbi:MAG: glycerol kinase GlpK [Gammaproteobacteria bacterium]